MKSSILKFTGLIAVLVFVFAGCAKDETEPEEETPTTPGTSPAKKFTWNIDGNSTVTADDSYFIPGFNNIVATKSTSTVDIILDDLNQGAHIISPSITLDYSSSSSTLPAKSGTIVITENTGSLIAGTFTCAFSQGSSVNSIKGEFSDVPKK